MWYDIDMVIDMVLYPLGNNRTMEIIEVCEIFLESTINAPEQRQWHLHC